MVIQRFIIENKMVDELTKCLVLSTQLLSHRFICHKWYGKCVDQMASFINWTGHSQIYHQKQNGQRVNLMAIFINSAGLLWIHNQTKMVDELTKWLF